MEKINFLDFWVMTLRNSLKKSLRIYKTLSNNLMETQILNVSNINTVTQKIIFKLSNPIGARTSWIPDNQILFQTGIRTDIGQDTTPQILNLR